MPLTYRQITVNKSSNSPLYFYEFSLIVHLNQTVPADFTIKRFKGVIAGLDRRGDGIDRLPEQTQGNYSR